METKTIILEMCKAKMQECVTLIEQILEDNPPASQGPIGVTPDVGGGQTPPPPGGGAK